MNVVKYEVKSDLSLLDKLFTKGDVLYATESFYVMNGRFDYAHKIFDADKNYLGMISRDSFPQSNLAELINQK